MVWLPPKDQPIYNLGNAYLIIKERLASANIGQQSRNSGATLQPDGFVMIKYLNQDYIINPKTGDVSPKADIRSVPLRDQILLLHYFTRANGAQPTGNQITFRDLPGGMAYYPTFIKRTTQPLLEVFGKDAPLLLKAGQDLNARKGDIGDASLIIDAFPKVAVTYILWQGDEELTANLNLLIDANILEYLESEDVTITCETITWRLINAVKKA
jgi:hypothetical protein